WLNCVLYCAYFRKKFWHYITRTLILNNGIFMVSIIIKGNQEDIAKNALKTPLSDKKAKPIWLPVKIDLCIDPWYLLLYFDNNLMVQYSITLKEDNLCLMLHS
ncbi:hypothetical protein ACJX0J_025818, partial [Zea mays]